MTATKKTVLITGSTRGIGLAFVQYYVNAGWNVIGTARANSNTEQLAALSPFKIVTMDTSDEATIVEAARQLEGVSIDLLINNAGIGIFTTFETASRDAIMKTLEVNALGPFLVTRALLPNLQLAAKPDSPAIVLQISSLLGSISSNKQEYAQLFRGQYGYTTSKAALNMITRTLAMDLRDNNVAVVTINPGYVETDMTNHQGVIKPDDAVAAMANIVAKLSLLDSGKFLNADPAIPASELPW
ncbi:Short chain dehydrogenase [Phytophthora palmivora]|uniref:Short chain dehydrogenase n=1 Tax=Phytophthora palmivora TaxID=4796 RepID=A0A2P4Y6F1_9STRA|nr:Short chain dehydrogenase [Phytophthora palmivora]